MRIKTWAHVENLPAGEYEVVGQDQARRVVTLRRGSETKEATEGALSSLQIQGKLEVFYDAPLMAAGKAPQQQVEDVPPAED